MFTPRPIAGSGARNSYHADIEGPRPLASVLTAEFGSRARSAVDGTNRARSSRACHTFVRRLNFSRRRVEHDTRTQRARGDRRAGMDGPIAKPTPARGCRATEGLTCI